MMSLPAQTFDNCKQINIKVLGNREKTFKTGSIVDSFINFYHGLKSMAELLGIQ